MGKLILFLFGLMWVVLGSLVCFAVENAREKYKKMLELDLKKFSVVPLALGVLLLITAKASAFPVFITILGVLGIVKGLFFLVTPKEKIRPFTDYWMKADNNMWRTWGAVAIIIGAIVLISI